MKKYFIQKKEVDNKIFKYFDIGDEGHSGNSWRVWVNNKIPAQTDDNGREFIEFPLVGADIKKGAKNKTLIMFPNPDTVVLDYFVECGYRGGSNYEIIRPSKYKEFEYYVYSSPCGNLGISKGAFFVINKDEKMHIKWSKSGRLYGSPSEGECLLSANGEECIVGDLEELSKELL